MVFSITGYLGSPTKHRPLLNQIPINVTNKAASLPSYTQLNQKRKFWQWFRARPELNSPVMIRVDDTISEVEFTAIDGSPLGRNKRLYAESLWKDNQIYERLKSVQFDRLVTGDGYIWKGKLNGDKVKEIIKKQLDQYWFKGIDMKELESVLLTKANIDEDILTKRRIDYVPASTVQIEHDQHDVLKYIQRFAGYEVDFKPDEIVHIPLHRVDGKVEGFTPVESLAYELVLLWAIKENMLSYIRNGGVPKKIFVMSEEIANSENHRWLVQHLMDIGQLENRHGNLVLTGKVEVMDLESDIKDMEYKDLALYVTSNIAYALRVPVSRVPYLIGSSATKGDAGGMAESGYWAMIESDQRTIEMHLNSQLFNELGFSIRFKRKYKIDDLREAQSMNFRIDAITKMRTELRENKYKLKPEVLVSLLSGNTNSISMSDVDEMTETELMTDMQKTGLLNRSLMPDKQVNNNPDKVQKNATKRNAAKNNPKNANQTGY